MKMEQNSRHNAEGYYSSLGHNVTVRVDIGMLPKTEQVFLLGRLMREAGVFDALRGMLVDADYLKACTRIDEQVEAWVKKAD